MEKSEKTEELLKILLRDISRSSDAGLSSNALDRLTEIYSPMIAQTVAKYSAMIGSGGDIDDLRQEAVIALYKAARTYREDIGVTFGLYAKICIGNRMQSVMRKLSRSYVPYERVKLIGGNPERGYIEREAYRSLRGKLDLLLTDYERRVLLMHLNGYSYKAISNALSKNEKSVDNALRRIRNKLRKSFSV
ncbi:MAG: sigma-70 family RNA polymerase sigma factor [Clostridia bacterium]|nr:sigma-70 family RNA polymerase sigma factor [Clostridia bacterium]